MNILPFIRKNNNNELPDFYGILIEFIDGKSIQLEVVRHIFTPANALEIVTRADEWKLFPVSAIKALHFDKNFSKIVAIKEREAKEAAEKKE